MLINNKKVLRRKGNYAITQKNEKWFYIWQRLGYKFIRVGCCTARELDKIMEVFDDLDRQADYIEADENP